MWKDEIKIVSQVTQEMCRNLLSIRPRMFEQIPARRSHDTETHREQSRTLFHRT